MIAQWTMKHWTFTAFVSQMIYQILAMAVFSAARQALVHVLICKQYYGVKKKNEPEYYLPKEKKNNMKQQSHATANSHAYVFYLKFYFVFPITKSFSYFEKICHSNIMLKI